MRARVWVYLMAFDTAPCTVVVTEIFIAVDIKTISHDRKSMKNKKRNREIAIYLANNFEISVYINVDFIIYGCIFYVFIWEYRNTRHHNVLHEQKNSIYLIRLRERPRFDDTAKILSS